MPLKLTAPREGRSKNWRIRGTYLGQYVDESAGTPDKKIAVKKLAKIRRTIESGEFSASGEPTFLSAAIGYIDGGGETRFLGAFDEDTGRWSGLIAHFGNTVLSRIDQAAIDAAAVTLLPDATAATRNRQVYTPVSAVLRHAGIEKIVKRPKGAQGKQRTDWLWPEQAFRIFDAARGIDVEFAGFLVTLCYTGMRLSEAIWLLCDNTRLSESYAVITDTKNDDPRGIFLPPYLVAELATHPRGLDRPGETVFRFRKNGHLYTMLGEVLTAAGADLSWVTFHTFCHTWATWMRRYGGLDTRGLVATGRWRDEDSARRYEHVVASEESRRAGQLPTPGRGNKDTSPKPAIRAKNVERKSGH